MATTTPKTAELVIIDYNELIATTDAASSSSNSSSSTIQAALEAAFGPTGVGIIGISNVPEFQQAKNDLLPLAYRLAHLPPDELTALEDPTSLYNAGWSHGKEQLKPNKPDWAKGSFYFNPIVDVPGTQEDRDNYPASYPINKWPSSSTSSSLPELEPAAKRMGQLMKKVAVDLSRHIDAYAHSKNPSYGPSTLFDALVDTVKVKGRLLYYFPLLQGKAAETSTTTSTAEDSWIGWHNDSGFLTALAGDLYINANTGEALDKDQIPPEAGLYVMDRANQQVMKVELPPHCMAIQMGECTQILTGGSLVATPHCVRGAAASSSIHNKVHVARASLACFIDTPPNFPLSVPSGLDREVVIGQLEEQEKQQQSRIPPLQARWTKNGMRFGEFLAQTFQMYYGWSSSGTE